MYGCVYHKEDGFCEKFSDDRCKSYCVMGPCQYALPSNADRIRSMTDEELAELFQKLCCPYSLGGKVDCNIENRGCGNCWLSWLKATVEEVQK